MRSQPDCLCCGAEFNTRGCILGTRCRCDSRPKCQVCTKCIDHHHRNCTEAVRVEAIRLVAELRERHGINIFECGERAA